MGWEDEGRTSAPANSIGERFGPSDVRHTVQCIDETSHIVNVADFRADLQRWYDAVKRPLPWRTERSAYRVWLSEIMLQQTRVDQMLPYYHRFTTAYPSVEDLARAPLDEVLRNWEGLGYYARARNLHRAAQWVVAECDGAFPSTANALQAMPGVGAYTSAAIASIVFEEPVAAVDGNVIRVIARLMALDEPVDAPAVRRQIDDVAGTLVSPSSPGDFNEAMMELGALCCTPRTPQCTSCPVSAHCQSAGSALAALRPVKRPKKKVPTVDVALAVILNPQGRILIQQRSNEGMLGGLWEFPGGKVEPGESTQAACRRELAEELGWTVEPKDLGLMVPHAYTHLKVRLHVFEVRVSSEQGDPSTPLNWRWVDEHELDSFAFPKGNRRIINLLSQKRHVFSP